MLADPEVELATARVLLRQPLDVRELHARVARQISTAGDQARDDVGHCVEARLQCVARRHLRTGLERRQLGLPSGQPAALERGFKRAAVAAEGGEACLPRGPRRCAAPLRQPVVLDDRHRSVERLVDRQPENLLGGADLVETERFAMRRGGVGLVR